MKKNRHNYFLNFSTVHWELRRALLGVMPNRSEQEKTTRFILNYHLTLYPCFV